jgi:lysophospholipase L1-like esterase
MAGARFARVGRVLLFNLLLACLLVEGLALVAYFVRTGKLYYTHRPRQEPVTTELEKLVEGYRIHPYFGYVNLPAGLTGSAATPVRTNNYGFESPLDYPYHQRQPGELLVGVFGGSAAARLAVFEGQERVLARRLGATLGVDPGRVTVLDFAQGGYKQPQQLLVLTYFQAVGQELDLVVNLDGFNDVALAGRNAASGVAAAMPSVEHVRALQDVTAMASNADAVEEMLRVRAAWARYTRWHNRAWSRSGWELRCATGFLFDWLVYRHYHQVFLARRQGYAGAGDRRPPSSWLYLNPATGSANETTAMAEAVALWGRCSELMQRAVAASGGHYLHLLQPNQYYPTARVLGEAERAVAISPRSPFAPYVAAGYPLLEAEVGRLQARGVRAVSLTRLFDAMPEPAYADDCCHFTDAGQRLIAETIADLAVEELAASAPTSPHIPGM